MEDVATNESKVTINGSSSATGKVPLGGIVMGEGRVRVLQVGNEDQPVVNPEIGDNVVEEDSRETPFLDGKENQGGGNKNSNIGNDNVHEILLVENRRGGKEMVDSPLITVGVLLASHVSEQVHDPTKKLLKQNIVKSDNWGILDGFGNASNGEKLVLRLGNKHHITLQVTSGLVVLTVRDSPRMVRNQKSRVKDPADNIVDSLGVREGSVTTLVGQNPASSAKEALNKSVGNPGNDTEREPRNEVEVGVSSVGKETNEEEITGNIAKGADVGALVALGRDGIQDLLDCELGDDKGVTVGVDGGLYLAIVLLDLIVSAKALKIGLWASLGDSYRRRHC